MKRSQLFVFEGPDGVGKTTLARQFAARLCTQGIPSTYLSFPGAETGTLGKHVYDLHHNSGAVGVRDIHPASLQLLHVAAHIDTIETAIRPLLAQGQTIVLDRYWWSTWVYGTAAGLSESSLQAMLAIEASHWADVVPTKLFLIRRPAASHAENGENGHLAAAYDRLAARERHRYPVEVIENGGSVEQALRQLLQVSRRSRTRVSRSQAPGTARSTPPELNLFEPEPDTCARTIFRSFAPAKPTLVFETYWRFAAERQAIFFRRVAGDPPPWTTDPVLQEYKFTNAYRASDRVSQYLIRHVIYTGDSSPDEVFFRTILFKFFNKISTWERLKKALGAISWAEYSFERFERVFAQSMASGESIYSAAYIMPSGGRGAGDGKKHRMHLRLLEQMMRDELPARIAGAPNMGRAFDLLRAYPTIGDFLAYQYVTDLNYSPLTNFSEMEFVVPGPGARDGIRKCFSDLGGLTEAEIIKVVTQSQEQSFRTLDLPFKTLWGRPLQLIDCQNVFCEVDKYSRVKHPEFAGRTGRTRIKQRYRMTPERLDVWYPPKWGLNPNIENGRAP